MIILFKKNKTLKKDSDFIRDYISASNASTGSKYDSNANVENKNVVTLGQELHKGKNIQQNRYIMQNAVRIKKISCSSRERTYSKVN